MNNDNNTNTLQIINPDAAGIDIGSKSHYVCVPQDRDKEYVRRFGSFTDDLHKIADWLKKCGIKTITMESTSVYWIPVYQILEQRGFKVYLVNAKHVKNVPGRKSDVQDAQWLQKLHSCGLLQSSFRPEDSVCVLRSYIRQRERLIKNSTTHVFRIQKALTEMNVQLRNVITDITGTTGMAIIRAIIGGERDPVKLAKFRDYRIKSSEETIIKSLQGDYRKEHLFVLKQEFELYMGYLKKIEEIDIEIEGHYKDFEPKGNEVIKDDSKRTGSNRPKFNLKQELYNMTGLDFSTIPGLNVLTIQTIISEVGTDMSQWKSENHFASWLGLSPANKITGEKVFSTRTRKVINRASTAFRIAAAAAGKTKTAIGSFMRRIKISKGTPKAITATARKIACLFYRLLKFGQVYVEQGMSNYEQKYKNKLVQSLEKRAKELGFILTAENTENQYVI
ncbi:IS110 family transposase [Candidatus Tisiphia endosymbiont of Oplodontha viridula]|uniref:IS110 family transposase n=1 Tax=Candidatus Tisiphia endosymbiont of Oplodontha viridula TaxID=3077925 RepID=UPI0035C8863E